MSEFDHFTSEQLAELTGTSNSWILRQCQKQLIPHHRLGTSVRFTEGDLRALAGHADRSGGMRGGRDIPTSKSVLNGPPPA